MKKVKFVCPGTYEPMENHYEHPVGESVTIQDDAFSIGEILERYTSGIHDDLARPHIDLGDDEPDIDDDVENPIDLVDIDSRRREYEKLQIEINEAKPKRKSKSKATDEVADTTEHKKGGGRADEGGEADDLTNAKVEAPEEGAE